MSKFKDDQPTTVVARPDITDTAQRSLVTSTLDPSVISGALMWAQPLTIAYQSKDLSLFVSNTASNQASATPTNTDESTLDIGENLPIGAKVGIGIGVSFLCIAIVGLLALLLIKRRRRQIENGSQSSLQQFAMGKDHIQAPKIEVDGAESQISELSVESSSSPAELEGEFHLASHIQRPR